jgi:hypothetical protein
MYFRKQRPIKILAKDAIYADVLGLSINITLDCLLDIVRIEISGLFRLASRFFIH